MLTIRDVINHHLELSTPDLMPYRNLNQYFKYLINGVYYIGNGCYVIWSVTDTNVICDMFQGDLKIQEECYSWGVVHCETVKWLKESLR